MTPQEYRTTKFDKWSQQKKVLSLILKDFSDAQKFVKLEKAIRTIQNYMTRTNYAYDTMKYDFLYFQAEQALNEAKESKNWDRFNDLMGNASNWNVGDALA